MAKHKVYMTQATKEVHKKDVEFEVFADDRKLGTLMISQGGVEWKSRYGGAAGSASMGWERFVQVLKESG